MSPPHDSSLELGARRLAARLPWTMPESLLVRTQLLLLVFGIANALPLAPLLILDGAGGPGLRLVAEAALALLVGSWVRTYRAGALARADELVEGAALVFLGYVAAPGHSAGALVLTAAYCGIVFRSFYGGPRRVALGAGVYVGAMIAILAFGAAAGSRPELLSDVLTNVLGIATTAVIVWLIARMLREHDDALRRERALHEQLAHRASHDELTGLANRSLFFDRLEHALAQARRRGSDTALLFLDLDGFKAVNDGLGHATGDEVLRAVARRLAAQVRAADTVARIGGDEFTILLEATSADDARGVADLVLAALAAPLPVPGGEVVPRASIGLALTSAGRASADELVRDADEAMYRAKGVARVVRSAATGARAV